MAVRAGRGVILGLVEAGTGLRFFLYNGWRFVRAPRLYYGGPFAPGVTGVAVATLNATTAIMGEWMRNGWVNEWVKGYLNGCG